MDKISSNNNLQDGSTLYAMVSSIKQEALYDWTVTAQMASHLYELDEHECSVVINQFGLHEKQKVKLEKYDEPAESKTPDLQGFLKEVFIFPPIDKAHLNCEPCMREENEKLLHVAFGIISPLTRLNWLGSGFIVKGKFVGEGKDAIVHAVKGNSDWVIKELKFGGEGRAKMLAFYTNKLADDVRLMVPELTHLDGGRSLQKFVDGSPTASIEWAMHQLATQKEAIKLAEIAKQVLGMRPGETYIKHGAYKVGVDPNFKNFLFNSEGKLEGWIDPLYSISR